MHSAGSASPPEPSPAHQSAAETRPRIAASSAHNSDCRKLCGRIRLCHNACLAGAALVLCYGPTHALNHQVLHCLIGASPARIITEKTAEVPSLRRQFCERATCLISPDSKCDTTFSVFCMSCGATREKKVRPCAHIRCQSALWRVFPLRVRNTHKTPDMHATGALGYSCLWMHIHRHRNRDGDAPPGKSGCRRCSRAWQRKQGSQTGWTRRRWRMRCPSVQS